MMRLELLRNERKQMPETGIDKARLIWEERTKTNIFILPALLIGALVGVSLSFFLKNIFAAVIAGLTVYEIVMSFGDTKIRRQQDRLDDQIEIFLVELGSVSGRLPFLPGIKAVLENTPRPLKGIIHDLVLKYEMGIPVELDAQNKDLKMLVELIRLKETYGGDISHSLNRLADKAKATRDLRADLKTSLKGGQAALVAQYGIITLIMILTLRQPMFQQVLIHTFGGRVVMTVVFSILLASAHYSRKAVQY